MQSSSAVGHSLVEAVQDRSEVLQKPTPVSESGSAIATTAATAAAALHLSDVAEGGNLSWGQYDTCGGGSRSAPLLLSS